MNEISSRIAEQFDPGPIANRVAAWLPDLVEIDGRYGRVEMITMRSTRMVTVDGKMIAIPNSVAVNTAVVPTRTSRSCGSKWT